MTSKLKCPFCNSELVGTITCPYCRNEKCEMCDEMLPRELLDLLDSTRKDLEIARKALEELRGIRCLPAQTPWEIIAEKALEQIEHKE